MLRGNSKGPLAGVITGRLRQRGFRVHEFDIAELAGILAPFEMAYFTVDPGAESIPEAHDDYEIWFVYEGSGDMICGDMAFRAQCGQLIVIEPGLVHHIANSGDTPLRVLSVAWLPVDS